VQTAKEAEEKSAEEVEGGKPQKEVLLWRRVSACCYRRPERRVAGVRGLSPKAICEVGEKVRGRSLFVCFDCDSLSKELKKREISKVRKKVVH